jgi:hypothetical protein
MLKVMSSPSVKTAVDRFRDFTWNDRMKSSFIRLLHCHAGETGRSVLDSIIAFLEDDTSHHHMRAHGHIGEIGKSQRVSPFDASSSRNLRAVIHIS